LIVNDLLEQEVDMMRNIHQDKPISIEVEEVGILELDGPERVLRILIGNLLRNACNYTPEGVITVRVRSNGISIADSGVGIDKQKLSQVFKPYYRGDQAQKPTGYGLGLTIVKRLCNRFGWKLTIASKMGEGTEVFLLLPNAKLRVG
jgi:signal transduction histidine kinase